MKPKMPTLSTYILWGFNFFLLILVFFGIRLSFYKITTVDLAIDPIISFNESERIKHILSYYSWYNGSKLLSELQHHLPYSNSISLRKWPYNILRVCIDAQTPLYVINNMVVLTSACVIVDKHVYEPYLLQECPHVTVENFNNNSFETNQLLALLKMVPYAIYNQYKMTWHSPLDAFLYDSRDPYFAIRFNKDSLPSKKLLKASHILKNKFRLEQKTKNKKIDYLIADIRFTNQIILYLKKEGVG